MSTDEPFLIAHKVRGEAAFDIAIKQPCAICQDIEDPAQGCDECDGLGHWWICSTSGHRAYPWWHMSLEDMMASDGPGIYPELEDMPEGLPDHYKVNAGPKAKSTSIGRSILASLGLAKPPIKRRI